jgi:predicted O-methyltransferase YrrM
MNSKLDEINKLAMSSENGYNSGNFTNLDDKWRNLTNWHDSYYRWLWAAIKLLQPKNVCEIGRERGVSATVMLNSLPKDAQLQSIDIVECTKSFGEPCFLDNFYDRRLVLITGDSLEVLDQVENNIEFLFVDGDHTYERVVREWEAYKLKLAPSAIVVFDDIHFDDGMTKFWDSIAEEKYDITYWHERGFGIVFMGG